MADLITVAWQVVLASAFTITGMRYLRRGDGESRDTFVMFATLIGVAVQDWVTWAAGGPIEIVDRASTLLLVAHPYAMLRVIDHWRPVPETPMTAGLVGLLGSWGLLAAYGTPRPTVVTVGIAVYFVLLEAYTVYLLVLGASNTMGATQGRLRTAATGSTLLAVAIVLALIYGTLIPPSELLQQIPVGLILVGFVAYFVAFASPARLTQAWDLSAVYESFQGEERSGWMNSVDASLDRFEETIEELAQPEAYLCCLDRHGSLEVRGSGDLPDDPGDLLDTGIVQETLEEGRPRVVQPPWSPGTWPEELGKPLDDRRVVLVPILREGAPLGICLLIYEELPLFVDQTASLLTVLGATVAQTLEVERQEQERVEAIEQEKRALMRERDALERADRIKDEFLATMSHEIRTPMNAIVGTAEVLQRLEVPEEEREHLQTIQKSGDHLLALIDDILNFSKIEAGEVPIARTAVDVEELVEDCLEIVEEQAEEAGLQLVVYVDPDVPAYVSLDPDRVRQILVNLLTNAVKFSDEGYVLLRCGVEGDPEQGAVDLWFEVEDTGIGIPEEKLEDIFEPFQRGVDAMDRTREGTGLGLAICARTVEMMDGDIEVRSTVGKGSTFRVSLPVEPVEGGRTVWTPDHTRLEGPDEGLETGRVLVVEDNDVNRRVVVSLVEEIGWEPTAVSSGSEALQALQEDEFTVVLLDIQMPGMDGYEVARRIQDTFDDEERPALVALSAHADESHKRRAMDTGFDRYVTKPIRMEILKDALKRARAQNADIGEDEPAPPTELGEDEPALVDQEVLDRLPEGMVEELLGPFEQEAREAIRELEQALEDGRFEEASRHGHKLLGVARELGALRLEQLADDIEHAPARFEHAPRDPRPDALADTLTATLESLEQTAGR